MATESNVDGGTKLLTASLLMTFGLGGALLFRQDPTDSPRTSSIRSEPAANELLVRRSGAPGTGAFEAPVPPRAPQPTDVPPLAGSGIAAPIAGTPPLAGTAQFSGAIDPFRNDGARAATQGRLTAEFGRPAAPSGSPSMPTAPANSQYAPSYLFVDPTSEAERTPLNNVTPRIELPTEYPGARSRDGSSVSSSAGLSLNSTPSNSAGMSPVGSAQGRATSPTASIQSPFVNTGTGLAGDASNGRRTVMPTLHAGSGAASAPAHADAARSQTFGSEAPPLGPTRSKNPDALRHKVRDGDTLPSLAAAYYGDAARYGAIFEANRDVLSSPDVLTIGSYLVIPSAEEAAATTAAAAANPPPAARLLPRVQIRPLGE